MTAPFFFPEITSGSGWGGPVHDWREKTLVFCRESPTIQPLGYSQQATRLAAVHGGFLTWAAKPRVRKSLTPQKLLSKKDGQPHFCAGCLLSLTTKFVR
jgi:hypothetical protein